MAGSLTNSLLKRGDSLAVSQGQLTITPISGEPVPLNWLATNRCKIMSEIAMQSGHSIYSYAYYQTGIYNKGRSPGVMIRFVDLLTGEDAYAVFNADLKRQRTTKNKRAGEPLPEGQFRIGERSALYLLWIKTPLDIPRRFAEWHKSMSKLQQVYFVAQSSSGGKLANKTIHPLSLSNTKLIQLFGDNVATSQRQGSDKLVTSNGDKLQGQRLVTSSGDKHIALEQASNDLEPDPKCVSKQVRVSESAGGLSAGGLSACATNRVLSNQVMTCKVTPISHTKKLPQEQSNDEWLQDYDSAS